jgi:hypothetical protein
MLLLIYQQTEVLFWPLSEKKIAVNPMLISALWLSVPMQSSPNFAAMPHPNLR